ncbi:MAG TPA: hypothetical protein VKA48_01130, partial [Gammaproteobacteria bacterium]|nr:hypothetical protein [Gammaproteobacteria bacterium]
ADGTPVRGYEENYQVGYIKAGLALVDLSSEKWFGRLEAGAKYPLGVRENVPDLNAHLKPGRQVSLYASYEVTRTPRHGIPVGLTLYYESYRFNPSPWSSSNLGSPVRQPESDMDVYGLRLGAYF